MFKPQIFQFSWHSSATNGARVFSVNAQIFVKILWTMSDNVQVNSDVIVGGKAINCEYAIQIMGTLFEDVDLRDIQLIAGIDKQKYFYFYLPHSPHCVY